MRLETVEWDRLWHPCVWPTCLLLATCGSDFGHELFRELLPQLSQITNSQACRRYVINTFDFPINGRDHIRVVLFDVGGVLVQLGGVTTVLEWVDHKITVEDLWRFWLLSPSVRAFETGQIEPMNFAAGVIAELNINVEPKQFLEAFIGWPTGLYPGALETIECIPPQYKRAVLSNSNSLHWPRIMNEMQLSTAFDHCFCSHLTGKIKPDADAFYHVLDSLDCSSREVLFLDDNLLNINAARDIGMHAVLVRGAIEARRALRNAGLIDDAGK